MTRRAMATDGEVIEGTNYFHGQEAQHEPELNCPQHCPIPGGIKLVQVVQPGTAFSIRCPNDCGIALRMV